MRAVGRSVSVLLCAYFTHTTQIDVMWIFRNSYRRLDEMMSSLNFSVISISFEHDDIRYGRHVVLVHNSGFHILLSRFKCSFLILYRF